MCLFCLFKAIRHKEQQNEYSQQEVENDRYGANFQKTGNSVLLIVGSRKGSEPTYQNEVKAPILGMREHNSSSEAQLGVCKISWRYTLKTPRK